MGPSSFSDQYQFSRSVQLAKKSTCLIFADSTKCNNFLPPPRSFGKPYSLKSIRQKRIPRFGFYDQQIVDRHSFHETAGVADDELIGLQAYMASSKAGIIPVSQYIHQGLTEGPSVACRDGHTKQAHLDLILLNSGLELFQYPFKNFEQRSPVKIIHPDEGPF